MAYNPLLDLEAGGAHRNYEVAELLKFWTERIMEIDPVERERPSLDLILERTPEVISVPRSSKRVDIKMGNGNGMLTTNLGVVWKMLRPSWCPHLHASLIEEVTERVRLAPTEDEDLATLMGTGLEEKARGELLSKMVELRKAPRKTREDKFKDSSTPKQKTDDKINEHVRGDKIETSNIIKSTNILKARAGGRQELEGLDGNKEAESVVITTTPPSKDVRSRKRKRDVEGLGSPSVDAVSEKT